jgi:3-isopropylmalate/(R)-2-methylmalate dehydratase large subunit
VELGSEYGLISPDEKTLSYIKGLKFAPKGEDFENNSAPYCRRAATEPARS